MYTKSFRKKLYMYIYILIEHFFSISTLEKHVVLCIVLLVSAEYPSLPKVLNHFLKLFLFSFKFLSFPVCSFHTKVKTNNIEGIIHNTTKKALLTKLNERKLISSHFLSFFIVIMGGNDLTCNQNQLPCSRVTFFLSFWLMRCL